MAFSCSSSTASRACRRLKRLIFSWSSRRTSVSSAEASSSFESCRSFSPSVLAVCPVPAAVDRNGQGGYTYHATGYHLGWWLAGYLIWWLSLVLPPSRRRFGRAVSGGAGACGPCGHETASLPPGGSVPEVRNATSAAVFFVITDPLLIVFVLYYCYFYCFYFCTAVCAEPSASGDIILSPGHARVRSPPRRRGLINCSATVCLPCNCSQTDPITVQHAPSSSTSPGLRVLLFVSVKAERAGFLSSRLASSGRCRCCCLIDLILP